MTRRKTRFLVFGLILTAGVAASCSKNNNTTAPSPVLTTETFSGTINPLQSSSHAFTVNYSAGYTDATFTITSLVTVANSTPQNITLGVGFGSYSVGVCTKPTGVSSVVNPAAPINTPLTTNGSPFGPGPYCIQVFDNPDAPTVTEPMRYTLSVGHY